MHRPTRTAVGAHYGFRDWLAQRITAVILLACLLVYPLVYPLAYLLALLLQLARGHATAGGIDGHFDFAHWAGLFHPVPMKLLGTLAAAALCFHAWVGMRDIWMDYIKPVGLRLTLHVGTILWLAACFVWSVRIFWSV